MDEIASIINEWRVEQLRTMDTVSGNGRGERADSALAELARLREIETAARGVAKSGEYAFEALTELTRLRAIEAAARDVLAYHEPDIRDNGARIYWNDEEETPAWDVGYQMRLNRDKALNALAAVLEVK